MSIILYGIRIYTIVCFCFVCKLLLRFHFYASFVSSLNEFKKRKDKDLNKFSVTQSHQYVPVPFQHPHHGYVINNNQIVIFKSSIFSFYVPIVNCIIKCYQKRYFRCYPMILRNMREIINHIIKFAFEYEYVLLFNLT